MVHTVRSVLCAQISYLGHTSLLYFKFPPLSHCSHWVICPVTFLTFWCDCFHVITCSCVSYKWKSTFLIRSRIITSKDNPDIFSLIKSTVVFAHRQWRSVVKPSQGRIYEMNSTAAQGTVKYYYFFCPWASQLVKTYQEEQFPWSKWAFSGTGHCQGRQLQLLRRSLRSSVPGSDVFCFWLWRLLTSPP